MLTSVSTSHSKRHCLAGPDQAGFSLLELLVVVILLGMLMMVMVPRLIRDDTGRVLQQESSRISDIVSQLTEQALFRGDLLALRLDTDGVEPLRYDWQENAFVAFEAGPLRRHTLPDGISLEWNDVAQSDNSEPSLAAAAEVMLEDDDPLGPSILGTEDAPENEREADVSKTLPQVFFFPSGEVSPMALRLYHAESTLEQEFIVTSLGTTVTADGERAAYEDVDGTRGDKGE